MMQPEAVNVAAVRIAVIDKSVLQGNLLSCRLLRSALDYEGICSAPGIFNESLRQLLGIALMPKAAHTDRPVSEMQPFFLWNMVAQYTASPPYRTEGGAKHRCPVPEIYESEAGRFSETF